MQSSDRSRHSMLEDYPNIERIGPGQLKLRLKLHTPLELLVLYIAAPLILLLAVGALAFFFGDGVPAPISVLTIPVVAWVIAVYVSRDNYYIIDQDQRAILFHRKILAHHNLRTIASFDDIVAVAVDCRKDGERTGRTGGFRGVRLWYNYFVVLVLKNEKIIGLTDPDEEKLHSSNDIASALAEIIEAPFRPGQSRCRIRLRRNLATNEVEIFDSAYKDPNWFIIVSFLVIAAIVIFVVMIALVPKT